MLPNIIHSTFETTLPSTGEKVKYRPLLVKEHKLLLKAFEFDDTVNLIETIQTIIKNCTFNSIDIDKLAVFDVEWLFLRIRDVSNGNIIPVKYKCKNKVDGEECGTVIKVNLDTSKARVNVQSDVEKVVMIDKENKIGIKLRYPTFSSYIRNIRDIKDPIELIEAFVLDCIEMVFEGEQIYVAEKDFTREELKDFIDQTTEEVANKIEKFVGNIPQIEMDVPIKCPKCGHEEVIELRGISDFFE